MSWNIYYLSLSIYQGWNYVYWRHLLSQDWGNMSRVPFAPWCCGSFWGRVENNSTPEDRELVSSVMGISAQPFSRDWNLVISSLVPPSSLLFTSDLSLNIVSYLLNIFQMNISTSSLPLPKLRSPIFLGWIIEIIS